MKRTIQFGILLSVAIFIAGPALSKELFVYPNKDQSKEQMEKDKYECYRWAKEQTGFDPMQQAETTALASKEEPKRGGLLRGAAKGAAVGAVGGAIAGDAGKGAAAGAATGGLLSGMRRRKEAKRQQEAEKKQAQEKAASYQQERDAYDRAYGACLEGRGYTVK